uniref:AAA+ ATPase domain-containing protein n=1 Tax=Panagrolaimus sp. ES5 TaxID=591445 RepID=A0AC34FBQ4_9BILA
MSFFINLIKSIFGTPENEYDIPSPQPLPEEPHDIIYPQGGFEEAPAPEPTFSLPAETLSIEDYYASCDLQLEEGHYINPNDNNFCLGELNFDLRKKGYKSKTILPEPYLELLNRARCSESKALNEELFMQPDLHANFLSKLAYFPGNVKKAAEKFEIFAYLHLVQEEIEADIPIVKDVTISTKNEQNQGINESIISNVKDGKKLKSIIYINVPYQKNLSIKDKFASMLPVHLVRTREVETVSKTPKLYKVFIAKVIPPQNQQGSTTLIATLDAKLKKEFEEINATEKFSIFVTPNADATNSILSSLKKVVYNQDLVDKMFIYFRNENIAQINNYRRQLEAEMDSIFDNNNSQKLFNQKQKEAIYSMTRSVNTTFILYGPPGSGKTYTIVEAVRRLLEPPQQSFFSFFSAPPPTKKILICTPSNLAADAIAEAILDQNFVSESEIFRLMSSSRDAFGRNNKLENITRTTNIFTHAHKNVPPNQLLLNDPRYLVQLINNHRSHHEIVNLASKLFYRSTLVATDPEGHDSLCRLSILPRGDFPILFHSVTSGKEEASDSKSYRNLAEVDVVVRYIQECLPLVEEKDIGVIAPYKFQAEAIRLRLKSHPNITVETVERFQGSERRVIIISTVRTSGDLGFVAQDLRINTAITRAKHLLIFLESDSPIAKNATISFEDDESKELRRLLNENQQTLPAVIQKNKNRKNIMVVKVPKYANIEEKIVPMLQIILFKDSLNLSKVIAENSKIYTIRIAIVIPSKNENDATTLIAVLNGKEQKDFNDINSTDKFSIFITPNIDASNSIIDSIQIIQSNPELSMKLFFHKFASMLPVHLVRTREVEAVSKTPKLYKVFIAKVIPPPPNQQGPTTLIATLDAKLKKEFEEINANEKFSIFVTPNADATNSILSSLKKVVYNQDLVDKMFIYFRNENIAKINNYRRQLDYETDSIFNHNSQKLFNQKQKEAIYSMTRSVNTTFILYGSPGSGKTYTIVEAIRQLLQSHTSNSDIENDSLQSNQKILICTPSNMAADAIAEAILEQNFISVNDIFRVMSSSRDAFCRNHKLENITQTTVLYDSNNQTIRPIFNMPTNDILKKYNIIICTLGSTPKLSKYLPPGHFSHIFVDEAAQASEMEIWLALGHLATKETRLILAGDPKQLGPVTTVAVLNKECYGFKTSLLLRLTEQSDIFKNPQYLIQLTDNHRSHHEIVNLSSKLFYYNTVIPVNAKGSNSLCRLSFLRRGDFPIHFHNVTWGFEQISETKSYRNLAEVEVVVRYIQECLPFVNEKDIGVIAPYKFQAEAIRFRLKSHPNITVETVERFQGSERRVIIISTVRTKNKLGFMCEHSRINTAITRAKHLLIIVGNASSLKSHSQWKGIIDFCAENRSFVSDFPRHF